MADTNTNKQNTGPFEQAPSRSSTQSFLDIDHINNGVVVMKDGGLRAVLYCSAINFRLKSDLEQDAIIAGYQSFLNALEIPVQIVIQSRKINLNNYLDDLAQRTRAETNRLLKRQMQDYGDYIRFLISNVNIMEKRFYVVVPHYPSGVKKVGFFQQLFGDQTTVAVSDFELEKKVLSQKVESVVFGLRNAGIRVAQLNTEELLELYHNSYNPDQVSSRNLIDLNNIEAEVIEKVSDIYGA